MAMVLERVHKLNSVLTFNRGYKIRVWAKANDLSDNEERETQEIQLKLIVDEMVKLFDGNGRGLRTADEARDFQVRLAQEISIRCFTYCNAVEVEINEETVIIYPDWP